MPLDPADVRLGRWENGTAHITGVDPYIHFILPEAVPVAGIRIAYTHANRVAGPARFVFLWTSDGHKPPTATQTLRELGACHRPRSDDHDLGRRHGQGVLDPAGQSAVRVHDRETRPAGPGELEPAAPVAKLENFFAKLGSAAVPEGFNVGKLLEFRLNHSKGSPR